MTQTETLRPVGMNNEQTECDSCGRMELRGTVIIANEEGEVGRYGTTCASKILGRKISRQDALSIEAARRSNVAGDLRKGLKALEAGDLAAAAMYARDARRTGLVRADEFRAAEKIEAASLAA